ncbi:MAG: LytTR family DNA-binding domain-containing protein [Crocinitomicaceae bacterium]
MAVLLVKCLVVAKMERSEKWTLKADIITLFVVFAVISVLLVALSPIVLKSWLQLPLPIDGEYFLIVTGFVHLIGFLLYFVSISVKYVIHGSPEQITVSDDVTNETTEQTMNLNLPVKIIIEGKNQGERLEIDKDELICISTNGHYIDIFLSHPKSDEPKKLVFRNTIVSVMDSLKEHEEFIHCHRSHIINLSLVEDVIGSSKKMDVKLRNLYSRVPVSRSKVQSLLEKLEKFKS